MTEAEADREISARSPARAIRLRALAALTLATASRRLRLLSRVLWTRLLSTGSLNLVHHWDMDSRSARGAGEVSGWLVQFWGILMSGRRYGVSTLAHPDKRKAAARETPASRAAKRKTGDFLVVIITAFIRVVKLRSGPDGRPCGPGKTRRSFPRLRKRRRP